MKQKYIVEYGDEWKPTPMSNRKFAFYLIMTIVVVLYSTFHLA